MKINKRILASPWLWYGLVMLFSLIEFCWAHCINNYGVYPDTATYIDAADFLAEGRVHALRTPVYPAIIGAVRWVFGSWYITALLALQFVAYMASAWYLRKIAWKLIAVPWIVFGIVALYCLLPGFVFWMSSLLTECFAACEVIFFIWCLVKTFPDRFKIADALWATFWLAFLIMLRPVFIYLLPVTLVYLLSILLIQRGLGRPNGAIVGLVGLVAVFGIYEGYKSAVAREYGIKSGSRVTLVNNFFLLRESGITDYELCHDDSLRQQLAAMVMSCDYATIGGQLQIIGYAQNRGKIDVMEEYINKALVSNPKAVAKRFATRFLKDAWWHPVLSPGTGVIAHFYMFIPPIGAYWILMFIFGGMLVLQWFKFKRMPVVSVLLYMITTGITIVAIVGAQGEWGRLMMPGLPACMLLIGKFLTFFNRNKNTFC